MIRLGLFVKLFGIVFLFLNSLTAGEIAEMQSDRIDCQGDTIVLGGSVQIEHPLGTLRAQAITLNRQSKHVEMNEGVCISLNDGKKITSDRASIDYDEHQATFSGDVVIECEVGDYPVTAKTESVSAEISSNHRISSLNFPEMVRRGN